MPSEISHPAVSQVAKSASTQFRGGEQYACIFSVRESTIPLWYRYTTGTTRFPRSAEATDGSTTTYRYRSYDDAGKVVLAVRCTIPRTLRATEIMDRRLGVDRAKNKTGGILMDVTLDPLVVSACQYGGDYPFCNPAPNPEAVATDLPDCMDWADCNSGGGDPIDGGDGGGLLGGEEPEPGEPTPCDPQSDPACEQPLTPSDSLAIEQALLLYVKDPSTISDPTARAQCAEMGNQFRSMFADGKVFRGSTTTTATDPSVDPHFGAYDPSSGHIHFDPLHLDQANTGDPTAVAELANTALHEAAHALGHNHGAGYDNPFGPGQIYAEDYFKWLSPGANSCLTW